MSPERLPDWDIEETEYPSDPVLEKIREWSWKDGFENLMQFIKPHWRYADCGYWKEERRHKGRKRYHLSTAGWSGNEDIIAALRQNFAFWALCWVRTERGGHYVFEVSQTRSGREENHVRSHKMGRGLTFKQGYHLGFLHGYLFAANKKIFIPAEGVVKDHASSLDEATRGSSRARSVTEPVIREVVELCEHGKLPQADLIKRIEEAAKQLKNCRQAMEGQAPRHEEQEWQEFMEDAELYIEELNRFYDEVFDSEVGRSIFSFELRDRLVEIVTDFSLWLEDIKSWLRGDKEGE